MTAEGTDDAIYLNNGRLAITATAILTGVLDAALVTVKNLIADHVKSIDGDSMIEISGSEMHMYASGMETLSLFNFGKGDDANARMYMEEYYNGNHIGTCELGACNFHLGAKGAAVRPFDIDIDRNDGKPYLRLNNEDYAKALDWKSNGDGTYTLIGR